MVLMTDFVDAVAVTVCQNKLLLQMKSISLLFNDISEPEEVYFCFTE